MIKLKNVEREFQRLKIKTKEDVIKQSGKITDLLLSDLVSSTPIDTGEARASWSKQLSGQTYKLFNRAEYIQYLNAGSSMQAPAFFIESTALRYGDRKSVV